VIILEESLEMIQIVQVILLSIVVTVLAKFRVKMPAVFVAKILD